MGTALGGVQHSVKYGNMIDDGKFVEADRGYRREQIQVRLPVDYKTVL